MAEPDRPVGELMRELSAQTSTLVHKELELAKLELTEKGKQAGVGAGMFGGAGVVGLVCGRRLDRLPGAGAGHCGDRLACRADRRRRLRRRGRRSRPDGEGQGQTGRAPRT